MKNKVRVGITIGDINGIGPEVILKSLSNETILEHITPVIYGSSKVLSYHRNIIKKQSMPFQNLQSAERLNQSKINIVNCWQQNVNIELGSVSKEAGECAMIALDRAVNDVKEGLIDCIVTAPINKEAMKIAGFQYPGHTEYLAYQFDGSPLMFMISDMLKVGVVSGHVPLKNAAEDIDKEKVKQKLEKISRSLEVDFGIDKPLIAVLGMNPHAGENGVIGDEEDKFIRPLIIEMKKSGKVIHGPFPADGFFGSGEYKKYDAILAMYHDQGLVPFKLLSFHQGVNYTAGLKYVRTSPDHGTGFKIAGQNIADHKSMLKSIYTAKDIVINRQEYKEMRENALSQNKS